MRGRTAAVAGAPLVGDVELFRWNGGCAFIGTSQRVVPMHAHQAIQITVAEAGECALKGSSDGEWLRCAAGIVASRQPHSLDATGIHLGMVLFVEPETREGRALTELYLSQGLAVVPREVVADAAAVLFGAFRARRGRPAVVEAAQEVVHALTGGVEPSTLSDERILRAVEYIDTHLDGDLTLNALASQVFLSPSRFRHLFVEQVGVGLRPFVLWRRLMRSWELAMEGVSLSAAAHRAGFADSSHLARTSRRMIGTAPSGFRVSPAPANAPAP